MMLQYLIDENLSPLYKEQLQQRNVNLIVKAIGEPGTPPKGTLDSIILLWCEKNNFILVTNNRASMSGHLADHLAQGRHVPGIFILNRKLSVGQVLDELILIVELAFENEFLDQVVHLPLRR